MILYFLVFRAMADFKKEVPLIIIKTVISDRIFINNFYRILGKKVETGTDFILLGSKITAQGDCSQEIKRYLLLGRKVMTNLVSI